MGSPILRALHAKVANSLDGLTLEDGTLDAVADARFGEVVIQIDHEREAESIRVSVSVAPPLAAGPDFLIWCLTANAQYWDVKIGLEDDGHLLIHADLEVEEEPDLDALATRVIDRVETILEFIDDDLTEWILRHHLGTPSQRERWEDRPLKGA